MPNYSGLHNIISDNCNIEAVCPYYDCENQHAFTWHRDERGVAVVSGYEPPWGSDSYDEFVEEYDPDMDLDMRLGIRCAVNNFAKNNACHFGTPPEQALIIAVYGKARRDLLDGCPKWRKDAERFFELDGFDVRRIREGWKR